jgi:hypothetical protein
MLEGRENEPVKIENKEAESCVVDIQVQEAVRSGESSQVEQESEESEQNPEEGQEKNILSEEQT